MTENIFNKFGIKKGETAAPWNKGKGLACLMHFPIPDWAVEEKQEGKIAESLWRHFEENQYSVSFVPYFTRGKHVGEPNWQKESVRVMFKTREEAEAYYRGSYKTKEGKWRTIHSLTRRKNPEEAEKDLEAYAERKGLVKLHLEGRA